MIPSIWLSFRNPIVVLRAKEQEYENLKKIALPQEREKLRKVCFLQALSIIGVEDITKAETNFYLDFKEENGLVEVECCRIQYGQGNTALVIGRAIDVMRQIQQAMNDFNKEMARNQIANVPGALGSLIQQRR